MAPRTSPGRVQGRRRPTVAAVALTAVALTLGACGLAGDSGDPGGAGGEAAAPGFPVTVESCGRPLTFDAPPERVVILSPMIAQDMVALGLADRVVGQSGTDSYAPPPETAGVPVLSPGRRTGTEQILGARPDLVLSEYAYRFDAVAGGASREQLEQAGVRPYVSAAGCTDNNTGTVDDQFADLENLGRIFGVPDRARQVADQLRGELADVEQRVASRPRPSVFAGPFSGGEYYPVAGIGLDALRRAGGDSVFPEVTDANATLSTEQITARDPDVIVQMSSDDPGGPGEARDVAALRAAFPTTTAVRTDRVQVVEYFPTATPGSAVAIVGGVRQLASILHPAAVGP